MNETQKEIWKTQVSTGVKIWYYISIVFSILFTFFIMIAGLAGNILFLIPGIGMIVCIVITIMKKNLAASIMILVFYGLAQVLSIILSAMQNSGGSFSSGAIYVACLAMGGTIKAAVDYRKALKAQEVQA